eukprot:c15985_g1_i2.p1 GENE.c15985_g1_i2~~c15985_g1_i2.p1  ORF type:complete len:468 (+),score=93.72 c15985_g1_i2:65-1405(+)
MPDPQLSEPLLPFKPRTSRLYYFCFLFGGVGLTYPWFCINAMINSLIDDFGIEIWVWIQLAFYVPVLPILITQTLLDEKFNRKFGEYTAVICRIVFSFVAQATVMVLVVFVDSSAVGVILTTLACGICCAIGLGTSSQLTGKVDDVSVICLQTGYQMAPLFVLAAQFASRFTIFTYSIHARTAFFLTAAAVSIVCMLMLLFGVRMCEKDGRLTKKYKRMRWSVDTETKALVRDNTVASRFLDATLPSGQMPEEYYDSRSVVLPETEMQDQSPPRHRPLSSAKIVFSKIRPELCSIFVSFVIGIAMVSILPLLPADNSKFLSKHELNEVLVYTNLLSNVTGRVLCGFISFAKNTRSLVIATAIRGAMFCVMLSYVFVRAIPKQDIVLLVFLSVMVILAGYVGVAAYTVACNKVLDSERATACLLVAICSQIGIYASFGISIPMTLFR